MAVIKMTLSKASIIAAKKALRAYKKTIWKQQCEEFVSRLADKGIAVAEAHAGHWGPYLRFSKQISPKRWGAKAVMSGAYTQLVERRWKVIEGGKEVVKSAYVNPLLMAEFGSGKYAVSNKYAKRYGAGRGTFPGQTHAWNDSGWSWLTEDDRWMHSSGEQPSMPMFTAYEEMMRDVMNVARQVFGT